MYILACFPSTTFYEPYLCHFKFPVSSERSPCFPSHAPCTALPQGPSPHGAVPWQGRLCRLGTVLFSHSHSFIAQHLAHSHVCFLPIPQGPQSQGHVLIASLLCMVVMGKGWGISRCWWALPPND